jgi:hypothetical protein
MLFATRHNNPHSQLAATRKAFPGARHWLQYAVLCGGGMVHRAGLSESTLVHAQARAFMPRADSLQLDKVDPVQLTARVPCLRQARAGGQLTPHAAGKLLTQSK